MELFSKKLIGAAVILIALFGSVNAVKAEELDYGYAKDYTNWSTESTGDSTEISQTYYRYANASSCASSITKSTSYPTYYRSGTYTTTSCSTTWQGPCNWSGMWTAGESDSSCECHWNACGEGGCYWACPSTSCTSTTKNGYYSITTWNDWSEWQTTSVTEVKSNETCTNVKKVESTVFYSYKDKYVIDIDTNGGSSSQTEYLINIGDALGEIEEPEKTGATFLSWSDYGDEAVLVDPYGIEGYTITSYTKSSGSSYINTGIASNADYDSITLTLYGSGSAVTGSYFGGDTSNTTGTGLRYNSTASKRYFKIKGKSVSSVSASEYKVKGYSSFIAFNDGTSADYYMPTGSSGTFSTTSTDASLNMYLFATNRSGTASDLAAISVSEFIISKGNDELRHFIPVVKTSTSVAGMYDLVEKKFYPSASSTAFTKGTSVINALTVNSIGSGSVEKTSYGTNSWILKAVPWYGYSFDGWYSDESCTVLLSTDPYIRYNTYKAEVIYAKFSEGSPAVTISSSYVPVRDMILFANYDLIDLGSINNLEISVDGVISCDEIPEAVEYLIAIDDGEYASYKENSNDLESELTASTGKKTIKVYAKAGDAVTPVAEKVINVYSVKITTSEGVSSLTVDDDKNLSMNVIEGKVLKLEAVPEKGYNFRAWRSKNTITYNLDGGTNSTDNPSTYVEGTKVTLQNPAKTDYTFLYWTDQDGNIISEISKSTRGNLVLTANWRYNWETYTSALTVGTYNKSTYDGSSWGSATTLSVTIPETKPVTMSLYYADSANNGNDATNACPVVIAGVCGNKDSSGSSWQTIKTLAAGTLTNKGTTTFTIDDSSLVCTQFAATVQNTRTDIIKEVGPLKLTEYKRETGN